MPDTPATKEAAIERITIERRRVRPMSISYRLNMMAQTNGVVPTTGGTTP